MQALGRGSRTASASTSTAAAVISGRPHAVAPAAEHRQPEQQRGDARLREAGHEARQQPRQDARAGHHDAPVGGPQHDRADGDHHERQEAPVDARVEEHRVDPEVVVELVGRHHLRVQEQRLAGVLDEAHPGEQDRLGDGDAEAPQQQLGASSGPSRGARTGARRGGRRRAGSRPPWRRRWSTSSAARTAARWHPAATSSRRACPRRRVRGAAADASGLPPAWPRARRGAGGRDARRDDQVQRHEQVHRASPGGDRDPEGQREHGEHRQGVRVAAHQHHQRGDHDERRRARRATSTPAEGGLAASVTASRSRRHQREAAGRADRAALVVRRISTR